MEGTGWAKARRCELQAGVQNVRAGQAKAGRAMCRQGDGMSCGLYSWPRSGPWMREVALGS